MLERDEIEAIANALAGAWKADPELRLNNFFLLAADADQLTAPSAESWAEPLNSLQRIGAPPTDSSLRRPA